VEDTLAEGLEAAARSSEPAARPDERAVDPRVPLTTYSLASLQCEEIASELEPYVGNPVTAAMRQSVGEAMLDALHPIEREGMSHRLSHIQAHTASGERPPEVLPQR
jgi:hypothetical protein